MNPYFPDPAEITRSVKRIMDICKVAWEKGLMAGWSGNASVRLPDNPGLLVITASGSPKGMLETDDCLLINLKGEKLAGKGKASSESQLHTILYEGFPEIQAILHTHPPFLQALELAMNAAVKAGGFPGENFLKMKLHEAQIWRHHLHFAENYPPGSAELAQSAIKGIRDDLERETREAALPLAVWLPGHGLCAAAGNLKDCLCLTEEMEHLAQVRLLSGDNFQ